MVGEAKEQMAAKTATLGKEWLRHLLLFGFKALLTTRFVIDRRAWTQVGEQGVSESSRKMRVLAVEMGRIG